MQQAAAETYQLFHYDSCPFCHRVRRWLDGQGIVIPLRNILKDPQAYDELVRGGGRRTVPCLRIERLGGVEWMYESIDIIRYLAARYGR